MKLTLYIGKPGSGKTYRINKLKGIKLAPTNQACKLING